ncbi:MAG: U32 family peptidase C-terminal domain-containing protein, partial [Curvibacter sp.]
ELEVFVHGALCIAYSGRCLLSGYFNHRDANQGTCTNACRWDYKTHTTRLDASGDVLTPPRAAGHACGQGETLPQEARDTIAYLLEESRRPGEFMPIEEDEHGTYVMNSKDLRAIEHIGRLVEIGVDSLKIEGRTKSPYYVARTVQSYRRAIDDAVAGRGLDPALLGQLEGLANRGYTSGFYQRHTPEAMQNYLRGYSESGRSQYVGDVVGFDAARGLAEVRVKNKFSVGDRLELIQPAGNADHEITRMEDREGQPLAVAAGDGHTVWLPLPAGAMGAFVARYLQPSESEKALA